MSTDDSLMSAPGAAARLRRSLHRLFAVDYRSLAACRIALALVLLVDLVLRIGEVTPFFTDGGMFSLHDWRAVRGDQWVWTLHSFSHADAWPWLLLGAQGLFAVLLLVGRWTRAATITSWVLAVSLHVRNPLITNSGDTFLRMMLFWGMFTRWETRWSLDARRRAKTVAETAANTRGSRDALRGSHASPWPAALLMLQVSCVYAVTGWLKLNHVWLSGEALQRVAALDFCIRPLGRSMAGLEGWLSFASQATPWFELLAPLLLWSPWWTARLRVLIVFTFIAFHAGIDLTLHVGMFGLVSQAAWLVFLPSEFWRRWSRIPADLAPVGTLATPVRPSLVRRAATVAAHGICGVAAVTVLFTNLSDAIQVRTPVATSVSSVDREGPAGMAAGATAAEVEPIAGSRRDDEAQAANPVWQVLNRIGELGMLHQEWTMFREPPTGDSWIVARAALPAGDAIDVLRQGTPFDPQGAPRTAARLPSQHWRYLFRRLTFPHYTRFAPPCAQYLLDDWNLRHPDRAVAEVALVVFAETYGEVGYETHTLATAGEPASVAPNAFDLDQALRDLDSALQLP